MNDHSVISDNGGGIRADDGTVVLNESSSIRGNATSGGIRLFGASSLTMNDSSTITGNASGRDGGGVELGSGSLLTMNDSATITGNRAGITFHNNHGGGVSSYGGRVVGVICAPKANANVYDNNPDDCLLTDRYGTSTR
jgi:hypothetical protein